MIHIPKHPDRIILYGRKCKVCVLTFLYMKIPEVGMLMPMSDRSMLFRGGILLLVVMGGSFNLSPALADPHTIFGGVVVIEVESFHTNISPRGAHSWVFTNSISSYSGNGYMEAMPNNDAIIQTNLSANSPELRYDVLFRSNMIHHVWVRGWANSGADDSIHFGVSSSPNLATPLTWPATGEWYWTNLHHATSGQVTMMPGATGIVSCSIWMREDGARIDRFVLTTNAGFRPRKGNAWHIPPNQQPLGQHAMRTPFMAIFTNTPVTIFSGSQFQGAGNPGNQLQVGSTIFYRSSTSTVWKSVAMTFHSESGNDKFYSGVIPPGEFNENDHVDYYIQVPFSDFLPTYLYTAGGVAQSTEFEEVARANPYRFKVLPMPDAGYSSPPDWRDINIYQIFTDRFYDGDPSNNNSHPESPYNPAVSNRIHGGDFRGIEKKLDYIKALGANAIWIKPIHLNAVHSAYHGYGAQDFYQLNPNLGTMADLTSMVAAAHARDIRVILDIVCNHQGRRIYSTDPGWPTYNASGYNLAWTNETAYPTPFNSLTNFHNFGRIGNFDDPNQLVLGALSGLDDLKTETHYVRTNMVEIFKYWIQMADFDGFRIDTVKHVEIGFWRFFNNEIRLFAKAMGKTNFIQFGEVFHSAESTVGYYTGTQSGGAYANDTVLNFPLYERMNSVFGNASGNTKQIEDHYTAIPPNFHPDSHMRLINFIDNHDVIRFMHSSKANNNTNKLALALSFLYTSRGIPCLYYGTEQNFNGGNDPGNREDMFHGQYEQGPSLGDNYNMSGGSFLHVAKMNNFRRLYPSLLRGQHLNRWNTPDGPGIFSYARRQDGQEILVILNTASGLRSLTNRASFYAPGTEMVNLLNTNEIITVNAMTNTPVIHVPAFSAKMFIARNQWLPLDPLVQAFLPGHDSTGHSVTSPVTLHFSKPMNTNLTAGAFSIQPPVMGRIEWSNSGTTLTFTPEGASRFSGETTYTVNVYEAAADIVDGLNFYAPFEAKFKTEAIADSDNDGIPDWWMIENFGATTGIEGNNTLYWQDADGDGVTNLEEFIAGTNPNDTNSYLRITKIDAINDNSGLRVEFLGQWGRAYSLESTTNLQHEGADWSTNGIPQMGIQQIMEFIEESDNPTRMFRLKVAPGL